MKCPRCRDKGIVIETNCAEGAVNSPCAGQPHLRPCPVCVDARLPVIGHAMLAQIDESHTYLALWTRATCPGCDGENVEVIAEDAAPLAVACYCLGCKLRIKAWRDAPAFDFGVEA